jgi:hypothetical protein
VRGNRDMGAGKNHRSMESLETWSMISMDVWKHGSKEHRTLKIGHIALKKIGALLGAL